MFPLLRTDPERAAWIDKVAADIGALAEASRAELDAANRKNRFPREVYAELGRRGYLGPMIPKQWGGLGGGVAEYVVINEEIGRHGMVTGQVAIQGQRWLLDWGTDEQKERWLRGIAAGELVFSESISEKNAGSSFKTMQATATRDGSDWILDGHKTHVNMGADCDVTLFYGYAPEGLTSFLVDTSLPGVTTKVTDAIGSRLIRTADVHFDNVRVRDADLLGPAGGGMQTFLSTFNVSRLGNASELIGLGRRTLELALRYAQQRQVGDSMVTDFQGIQWMVADSWTALQAASLARDLAAVVYDQGQEIALHTTAAKQLAITGAESASRTAYSMTGGHSLYFDQPYTDIDNEIKVLKVAGGSSEIMRNYIARRILKDSGHEGVNPDAVEVAARLGGRVVWMPTVSARAHKAGASSPELSVHRGFELGPVDVDGGVLRAEWHDVLGVIAAHDLVLASGHLSADETVVLFREARRHGVGRLVVNHPMMAFLGWNAEAAELLAGLGAHLELGILPDLLGDEDHASLRLTASYPASLLVFGGDLGHAHHVPPSVAVPPWLHRLERCVGPGTAAAIMTTQTSGLLLP